MCLTDIDVLDSEYYFKGFLRSRFKLTMCFRGKRSWWDEHISAEIKQTTLQIKWKNPQGSARALANSLSHSLWHTMGLLSPSLHFPFLFDCSVFPAEGPEASVCVCVCVIHHAKKPSVMNSPSCSIYATLKIDTWQIKESAPLLLETHFFHSVTLFFSILLFLTLNSTASCCVRVFRGLSDSWFTEICLLLHRLSTLFSHFPTLSHSNALSIAFFLHQGSL